jgi:hypothetical protein
VENRGLEALGAPPKREKHKIHKVLFIDKIKRAARSGVRSNALAHASALLDVRSAVIIMQCRVRSSVGVAFDRSAFDRTKCIRT